ATLIRSERIRSLKNKQSSRVKSRILTFHLLTLLRLFANSPNSRFDLLPRLTCCLEQKQNSSLAGAWRTCAGRLALRDSMLENCVPHLILGAGGDIRFFWKARSESVP